MRQAVPLHQQLAATIKGHVKAIKLHTQQIVTLQSQAAAAAALQPGAWEAIALQSGWSNVSGAIPAQARLLTTTTVQVVGNIQGGSTGDGTIIGTLTKGYYNTVHAHTFAGTAVAGAESVEHDGGFSGSILVPSGTNNVFGTVSGSTCEIVFGPGGTQFSPALDDNGAFPKTNINMNVPCITLDTSGNLSIANFDPNVTQISFHEAGLPLFTG